MVEGLTFFSSPTKGSCQEGPEDFTASARRKVAPRQGSKFRLTHAGYAVVPITSSL